MFDGVSRTGARIWRGALTATIVAAGLAAPVGAATRGGRIPPLARAAGAGASARVTFGGAGQRIPRGFFGLSIEYNELRTYERAGVLFDRVLSMIRPRDGSALLLRIGGKSADHMLWEPDPSTAPKPRSLAPGVFELGYPWLDALADLVRREHLRVILDLNLAVHSPTMAADFAAAVRKALPRGSLAALEIGNEPDMYHYQPRLTRERVATTTSSTPWHWWNNYSDASYRRDYAAYAQALHARVPGIRVGAPDITAPRTAWFTDLAGLGTLRPGFLAVHRYGASGCFAPGSPGYPTVSNLLNNLNSSGLAASVSPWVSYAHARGMGLRVSEINSVSCGRDRGVADAFATALWAPDTLFSMIRAGVDAISWHIRPSPVNAPFHIRDGGIVAEPELYALAMFAAITHGPANLLNSQVSPSGGAYLKAWAVRRGGQVNVLLINKGHRSARVSLRGLARGQTAWVRLLSAPGVHATGGVRFQGERIGRDGLWHGTPVVRRLGRHGAYYHLDVPGYSATLVTL